VQYRYSQKAYEMQALFQTPNWTSLGS